MIVVDVEYRDPEIVDVKRRVADLIASSRFVVDDLKQQSRRLEILVERLEKERIR